MSKKKLEFKKINEPPLATKKPQSKESKEYKVNVTVTVNFQFTLLDKFFLNAECYKPKTVPPSMEECAQSLKNDFNKMGAIKTLQDWNLICDICDISDLEEIGWTFTIEEAKEE